MPEMAQMEFHRRVMLSIGVIARTPSESPATLVAHAPSRVSSAVGTCRVPSLSLRRLTRMPFKRPAGSRLRFGRADIGAPGPLCHPLAARPRHLRVAAREARDGSIKERGVLVVKE